MCIKVQVSYLNCSHVHLGYELCSEIIIAKGFCSRLKTHPRIDPFCPLCSKIDYRHHKRKYQDQLPRKRKFQQVARETPNKRAAHHDQDGQYWPHTQPQESALDDSCSSPTPAKTADASKRISIDSDVSDSSSTSSPEIDSNRSSPLHVPPPCPIEPSINPQLFGPHHLLEYRQRLAMGFGAYRRRNGLMGHY